MNEKTTADVFHEEMNYFKRIMELLEKEVRRVSIQQEDTLNTVRQEQSDLWEQGTHLIRDFDDVVDLASHNMGIMLAEKQYEHEEDWLRKFKMMRKNPYFGRIDFKAKGESSSESLYIGRHTLLEPDSLEALVIDWRAPISSMFYESELGPASYMSPNGEYSGILQLKRQYSIEKGNLINFFDTDTAIQDRILERVLMSHTEHALKVIIQSIQREQNIVIRHPGKKNVLIHGLAGSGKTSVGMHRLAYLLYRDRGKLYANGIVILSNNHVFGSYIENVLPELGEEKIQNRVYADVLRNVLPSDVLFADYYEQVYDITENSNISREKSIQITYCAAFIKYCEDFFHKFPFSFDGINYFGEEVLGRETFFAKMEMEPSSGFRQMLDRALFLIENAILLYFIEKKDEIKMRLLEKSEVPLSADALEAMFHKQQKASIIRQKQKFLTQNGIDPFEIYQRIRKQYSIEMNITDMSCQLNQNELPYEDAQWIAYIQLMMGRTKPDINVEHVLLDEAQDCNLLQLTFLRAYYPNACFTLLADTQQVMLPATSTMRYDDILQPFHGMMDVVRLPKSYRSSGPINQLAFQLIGEDKTQGAEYFHRDGEKPVYKVSQSPVDTLISTVKDLQVHYATIGIISPSIKAAKAVFSDISDRVHAQLVVDPDSELETDITVMPLLLAKGLEFDAVVAVGFFEDGAHDRCRNVMYLTATRALHSLCWIESHALPDELTDCLPYMTVLPE